LNLFSRLTDYAMVERIAVKLNANWLSTFRAAGEART
jgi:hypothetical protein